MAMSNRPYKALNKLFTGAE